MNQYRFDKKRLQEHMPELRKSAGLTLDALAQKVGVTKQAISLMETHQEKPITKMQYISIRAAFEEEYLKNPDNINLRDCYDLVFSDPTFYLSHKEQIEFALYKAGEDTKKQKRISKTGSHISGLSKAAARNAGLAVAGATAATVAAGGVAATVFPLVFSALGIVTVTQTQKKKQTKGGERTKRATNNIKERVWLREAFEDSDEDNSLEE